MDERDRPWGMLAEFATPEELVRAVRRLRAEGVVAMDAHTPFPVPDLEEALDLRPTPLGWIAFVGGAIGGLGTLLVQWYTNAVDYPINVGGRPLDAWVAFALPAAEVALVGAGVAATLGFLLLCRLPRFHHPLFSVDHFARASGGAFFVAVESRDRRYDRTALYRLFRSLGAVWVGEVPR